MNLMISIQVVTCFDLNASTFSSGEDVPWIASQAEASPSSAALFRPSVSILLRTCGPHGICHAGGGLKPAPIFFFFCGTGRLRSVQ